MNGSIPSLMAHSSPALARRTADAGPRRSSGAGVGVPRVEGGTLYIVGWDHGQYIRDQASI